MPSETTFIVSKNLG